jgi:KDO2-lipid IV(A) lauroyltransferase
MARPSNALIEWSQYAALRGVATLLHCFDVNANMRTAAMVGSLFYRLSGERRRRAEGNIAASFPDWPADRVRDLAERSMQHMFQLFMVDALVMPRLITPDSWPQCVRLGPLDSMVPGLLRHEPAIFITGHCGNWEVLGYALATIGFPMHALARPLDNRRINRWLLSVRQARGMRIITKWGATPVLQDVLERGGRLGFIADQNAGDQGLFVPFFGRLASSYKSIGLLAMRYRVPIAASMARRLHGRFEYEIEVFDVIRPDDWIDQPDPLFYITARYNRAMETMIRAAPEQYLWVHRRWKSRPRHERLGRPIPGAMVEKLESLPWMTPDELHRIVGHSSQESSRRAAAAAV